AQLPAPPTGPSWVVPFSGTIVSLTSTGSGEALPTQNFGTLAAGVTSQTLALVVFPAKQSLSGVQFSIQARAKGEFAVLAPSLGGQTLTDSSFNILIEFRPKTAGTHTAEVQLYGTAGILARIPITGTCN